MNHDESLTDSGVKEESYLMISGYHDYRSKRRVDLHFICDELKKIGNTSFLSLRYSYLNKFQADPRQDLTFLSNQIHNYDGVTCFLWRTLIHPVRLPSAFKLVERAIFKMWSLYLPRPARSLISEATVIFIECGLSVIYLPLIHALNGSAKIIYMASDSLDAINQATSVKVALKENTRLITCARVPSPYLLSDVPNEIPCFFIPHGIDKAAFAAIGRSPFAPGTLNAVSVGSMLFDPSFFNTAAPLFPQITFHVIGSGYDGAAPENVVYYPEKPFEETLPFLKHANFAIAPYGAQAQPYLTHTSMKLSQYGFLGIPAVCPKIVCGDEPGRFGYTSSDAPSIVSAISDALFASKLETADRHWSWAKVVVCLLESLRSLNDQRGR